MHGNSDVVDTVGFSAIFAQARQSSPGEVIWKPERCYQVQFRPSKKCFAQARSVSPRQRYSRPGENGPETSVLSRLFSSK